MGKRNRKKRKTEKMKDRASVCNSYLRRSPRLSSFSAQGISKASCWSLLSVVNHNELFHPCAAPTQKSWRPCNIGAWDIPSVSVHLVKREKKSNSEGTIKPWAESPGSTQEETPVQRPAWSSQGLPFRTGVLGICINSIRKRAIT